MEVGMEMKEYLGKMFRLHLLRKRILGDIVEKNQPNNNKVYH